MLLHSIQPSYGRTEQERNQRSNRIVEEIFRGRVHIPYKLWNTTWFILVHNLFLPSPNYDTSLTEYSVLIDFRPNCFDLDWLIDARYVKISRSLNINFVLVDGSVCLNVQYKRQSHTIAISVEPYVCGNHSINKCAAFIQFLLVVVHGRVLFAISPPQFIPLIVYVSNIDKS